MELEQQITELITEVKTARDKEREEIKIIGTATSETKAMVETLQADLAKAHTQLDALDLKMSERITPATFNEQSIGEQFIATEAFQEASRRGFPGKVPVSIPFEKSLFLSEQKATITNIALGAGTSGVAMPSRLSLKPLPMAQIGLRVRDILNVRKLTTGYGYDWLRQKTRTNAASPQQETSPKAESTYEWEAVSGTVKTIAHYVNISKQALSDSEWIREMIDSELMYGLKLKEEVEILSGDGLGAHLSGIIPQATAYAAGTYNVSGDTKLDKLRHAKLQARLLGLATFSPDAFVLHPTDMHTIELIKDQASNVGNYVVGDPKTGPEIKTVWGLPVVESDSIAVGTFLVGSFARGATLIDRQTATIEISYEHDVNFTKNLATILCEERIGLAVQRPDAFVTGAY